MSSASYQSIQEKMGETTRLVVSDLLVSEYNARCSFVDRSHVEHLANLIQERGFHPTRAILVNIIQNAVGEPVAMRVVAGRHRFEAAKLAGLTHIPCVQYCELTDEEETFLDRWDNEMDEEHIPVHFLAEAEHCKFLVETKGWSQRKIAQSKKVSRTSVRWKIQIAELPKEVKTEIMNSGQHVAHLKERHILEICKLNDSEHMLLICKEIIERGQAEEEEVLNNLEVPVRAMKQREVATRVAELLKVESKKNESPIASEGIADTDPDDQQGGQHVAHPAETPSEEGQPTENRLQPTPSIAMQTASSSLPSAKDSKDEDPALTELRQQRIAEQQNNGPLGVDSEKRSTVAMKFDVVPCWLKCSSFPHKMKPLWPLFELLIKFEMRYLHGVTSTKGDVAVFFIGGSESSPEWTYQFLGGMLNQASTTIQKKLRLLEKYELIKVERANLPRYPRFQIRWDRVKNLYDEESWSISFKEGGLEQFPSDFSGQVQPTPLHTIWVRDGIVQKGVDDGVKETIEKLEGLGASPKFALRILKENYLGTLRQVLAELSSKMEEHQQRTGKTIRKPIDFFLGCLKTAKENQKGI